MRAMAFESLCGISDTFSRDNGHNAIFYQRPKDGKMLLLPWDWDFSFVQGTSAPLWTAAAIATGNTLEAVVAATLLRRNRGFDPTVGRLADAARLIIIAAALATTISATVGVVTLCAADLQPWSRFWRLWSAPAGVTPQVADATTRAVQGALEKSNVQAVLEINRMMEITRTYATVSNMQQRTDELRRKAIEKLAEV